MLRISVRRKTLEYVWFEKWPSSAICSYLSKQYVFLCPQVIIAAFKIVRSCMHRDLVRNKLCMHVTHTSFIAVRSISNVCNITQLYVNHSCKKLLILHAWGPQEPNCIAIICITPLESYVL